MKQLALNIAQQHRLDRPDDVTDAAWAAKAEERLSAYRSGQIRAIPLSDVLAKYRAT